MLNKRGEQSSSKQSAKVLVAIPWLASIGLAVIAFATPPASPPYRLVVPAGLPAPRIPADNPLTVAGVALGQRLFTDVRLSGNNTQSCSSCHRAGAAFSDAGKATSVGIDGIHGTRNAPSLVNTVYAGRWFWDGRAPSLRSQAVQPIQNPIEMHQTLTAAVAKLSADATYLKQFNDAFWTAQVTSDRIGLAIEQYETTLLGANSKFDLARNNPGILTAQEQRGQQLFFQPFNPQQGQFGADCARCHGGPLFSDARFHNNGLDAKPTDPGFQIVTNNPADFATFRTPSLRDVSLTGPYMHDGRFSTLEQVVQHYSNGIVASPTLDRGLANQRGGVHLSAADQAALVAFLQTLTTQGAGTKKIP